MKDHEVREFVNALTAVAKEYANTQQLRERIHGVVLEALGRNATSCVVPARGSTYEERFVDAVRVLTGAVPPEKYVQEWFDTAEVNGLHRLQGWVLSQPGTPPWCQGIVLLDAAHILAETPEDGKGHHE